MSIQFSFAGTLGAFGGGAGTGLGLGADIGLGVGADAGAITGDAGLPLAGSFMAMLAGFDPASGASATPGMTALNTSLVIPASAVALTASAAPAAAMALMSAAPGGGTVTDPLDALQDIGSASPIMLAPDPSLLAQMQMAMGAQLPAPVITLNAPQPAVSVAGMTATGSGRSFGLEGFGLAQVGVESPLVNSGPLALSIPSASSIPLASGNTVPTQQPSLPGVAADVATPQFGSALPGETQAHLHKAVLPSPTQAAMVPAAQPVVMTGLAQMMQPVSARTNVQAESGTERAGDKPGAGSAFQAGKVVTARAESRLDTLFTAAPAVALGDSLRQWLDGAKLDKPLQGSNPALAAGVERSPQGPAGAWNFAASEAHAVPDNAALPGTASDFAVQQQVADQVSMWVSQNIQSAELKLDALGHEPVEVSITLSGSEASIEFRTDRPEIRDLLSRATAQLNDALQREGLVLGDVSVGSSGKGRDNPGEPGDNARGGGKSWRASDVGEAPVQAVRMTAPRATAQGAVDLFV